jgi:preprotein translocase subunit SecG
MQINNFSDLPGFVKWFLVLAALYLPVLICFLIMLQRESSSDLRDFLRPFNFGKRFGILKRSIASESWLMRLCGWCMIFMLPLVYAIALVYFYFGVVTLDFGLSILDSQRKQVGIPGNQAELQVRYDQMTADER